MYKKYKDGGSSLNLSFITDNIIVSIITESKILDYLNFFRFFGEHCRIYNFEMTMLEDRFYDVKNYSNQYNLETLIDFQKDAKEYLTKSPRNIVVINCKNGGLLVSILLDLSSKEAFDIYHQKRFINADSQRIIPSQMRYADYVQRVLPLPGAIPGVLDIKQSTPLFSIKKVIFHTIPSFDFSGGCNPYITVNKITNSSQIEVCGKKNYTSFPFYSSSLSSCEIDLSSSCCLIYGDSLITFYDHDDLSSDDLMFSLHLNSRFIDDTMTFTKLDLDVADSYLNNFKDAFLLEIHFEKINDDGGKIIHTLVG